MKHVEFNRKLTSYKSTWYTKIFGDRYFVNTFCRLFFPAALQSMLMIIVLYVDNFSLATLVQDKELANLAKEALGLASPIVDFQLLIVCGWIGGIGIIFSQYYGSGDYIDGRKTLAFRFWSSVVFQIPLIIIISTIPGKLIGISSGTYQGTSYELARIYLFYSTFTFIPCAMSLSLTFSLEETKRAGVALLSAAIGVITNIILDPIVIIFVKDINLVIALVAISTGIARIIQLIFILIYIIVKQDLYLYFFNSWKISLKQICLIMKNSISVFINETIYALANMILVICLLSFNTNIHDAMTNLILMIQFTTMIWPGIAAANAVLVGSELGANRVKQAKKHAKILMVWGSLISLGLGLIMFIVGCFVNPILSPAASESTIILSRNMEWIMAPIIVTQGITAIAYNTTKAGGSKLILFIDGGVCLLWLTFIVPITFTGVAKNMDPMLFLFLVQSNQILKMIISFIMFKYANWAKVLTNK